MGEGRRWKLTEKSNGEALQDASPPPQEEVAPGVGQEADYSAGERHQEVGDGQVDDDVVEGLPQLLELKSDEHDEEVLAQGQQSDQEHDRGEHGVVPRRDVLVGSDERIVGAGQFRRHGVGHRVHCQAQVIHRPCAAAAAASITSREKMK